MFDWNVYCEHPLFSATLVCLIISQLSGLVANVCIIIAYLH